MTDRETDRSEAVAALQEIADLSWDPKQATWGRTLGMINVIARNASSALGPEREEAGLGAAAREVLLADAAAENGDDGADLRWDEAVERLRAALAADAGHPEDTCQRCSQPNPIWSAPNDSWNAAMGTPDNPRGEGIVVCPSCFVRAALAAPVAGLDSTPALSSEQEPR